MVLWAASVKAQVRIGGNAAPSAAAVLDLNATDAANTGTGGLVLPRVDLKTNTMQLTTGIANLTGTLVYNTTATLGAVGIYFWNGATWVKASLPTTSPADSGKFLMSNGSIWITTSVRTSTRFVLNQAYAINAYFNLPFPTARASSVCVTDNYGTAHVDGIGTATLSFQAMRQINVGDTLWVNCVN